MGRRESGGPEQSGPELHDDRIKPLTRDAAHTPTAPAETHAALRTPAEELSQAFADLAEQVTPSVVQIQVVLSPDSASAREEPSIPEDFRQFFDLPFGAPQPQGPQIGGGSGFLISSDGYIMTNNHVVRDADRITVTLNDHRVFDADVVGTDPTTDVAVIRIHADNLPFLTWGNSDRLRVGEWVMAVGNPGFGDGQLDYTVTTGIVSAKGRPLQLIGRDLQSDPRYKDELSGYAIESTDGHYQGYGFAIPADLVHKVSTDIVEHGHVLRPWLGVQVAEVGPEDAEVYHLPSVSDVVVQGVTEGSPAASAGFKQGDVIVSVDGQPVTSGGELQEIIAVRTEGETVQVAYYRDGHEKTAEVRLGEAPVSLVDAGARSARHGGAASAERLGLSLQAMDPGIARQLGYKDANGVIVTDVDRALSDLPKGQVVTLLLQAPSGETRIANVRVR